MELPEDQAEELLAEPETTTDQPQQLDEPVTNHEAPEETLNDDEMVDEEAQTDDAAAQQLAQTDQPEEPDYEPEEEQAEEKKPKIFVSYNHNENDTLVATRIYHELRQHYDVFIDQQLGLGLPFPDEAQNFLRVADFVVALISHKSLESDWVTAELEEAFERSRKEGRPRIIPVRVNYNGPYNLILRVYIGRLNAFYWDNDYPRLFERLHAAIGGKESPVSKPAIVGTDIIPIANNVRKRYAETFVEPREIIGKPVSLQEQRLLWVTGDSAVRTYIALSLAARTSSESVYEISKRRWSEINDTYVSDSTIVLRDAPATYLTESSAIAEWHSLRAIIERNNIVIATAADDEFERLQQELLRYQFTDYQRRHIDGDSYDVESKLSIFTRLVDFTFAEWEIADEDKYAWVLDLTKDPNEPVPTAGQRRERALERRQREMRRQFRENIDRWSPADIENFVLSLSQARSQSDIARLLKRTAAIEDEIRSWFVELDDSTRSFIATVALFSDFSNEELWEQYKAIVEYLRPFDQHLRLLPFGICRKRAYPYVSSDGPIKLDDRAADAIRQEVARSYREYFVELIPKLKEWSVPAGRNPKTIEQRNQRKPKIEETREARLAIARMVGIAARLGLDDITDILNYWATDSNIQIRKSVAFAFEHTARRPTGVNYALDLLEKWCVDLNSNGQDHWRALTAADALGYVTAAAKDPYVTSRALHCLRAFAKSRRKDARFYASMALRRVARYASLSSTEGILSRLAKDDRIEVRLNVAAALNETRSKDPQAADELFERWAHSDDPNRRWVALCGIVTSRPSVNGSGPNKYDWLLRVLEDETSAETLASVLGESVTNDRYGQIASDTFSYLAQETSDHAWTNLAAGLGGVPVNKLEKDLLPILRFLKAPLFDERAIDVRRETLRKKLADPAQFLKTLNSWLNQAQTQPEVFRALTQLLKDSVDSSRLQFIAAMAQYFSQNPGGVNDLLSKLETLAPAHFVLLSRAVTREAFKRLLQEPVKFLAITRKQLADQATCAVVQDALEQLAHHEPAGSREKMLLALLEGHAQAPEAARELLLALKSSGRSDLVGSVHEFNYRLIETAMNTPATFPTLVLEMLRADAETLSLLNYLAADEPQGQRSRLVRALVEARLSETAAADELLALSALKEWTNLASLAAEVSRSFYVRKIFSPKFVRKLFIRK